ncbi:MAG TPA: iron ABC transporter permease, partial [Methylomirabilota bacterium]|nr:iron ABC transporter permease [Methylomirabilota bacterium]
MTRRAATWWAALGLGAFAGLPWSRGAAVGGPVASGLALAASHRLAATVGLTLLLTFLVALARPTRRTGRALVVTAGGGTLLALGWVVASEAPLGVGALVTTLSLLTVSGLGLARAGLVRGGGFVGAAILWASLLVGLFVVYPLVAMLHASVVVQGHVTPDVFLKTLGSPIFLLVAHEALPVAPGVAALWGGAAGLAAALAWTLHGRRRGAGAARVVAFVAIGGLAGLLLAARGALRNSFLLALLVGVIATGLGLAFALLDARSRLPTRRLLAPLSVLPIITPAFVLGLAFIYLFGRRGSVTHGLLGLDSGAFFGPLGVGA